MQNAMQRSAPLHDDALTSRAENLVGPCVLAAADDWTATLAPVSLSFR
jgi:hypothetical protein